MKGKKKLVLPLLLAGVTATTGYVAPVAQAVNVNATTQNEYNESTKVIGASVQVTEGFSDDYKVGDKVWLPSVTVSDSSSPEFTVTKGGETIEVLEETESGANHGKKYFVANYEGYYDVTISTTGTDKVKTTVENLRVWVNKSDATIVLPVNSEYVIPAKMPINQENFKIPAPSVIIGDEEDKTSIENLEDDEQLVVFLYKPDASSVKLTLSEDNKYYAVNSADLAKAGTYTIVYEFRTGDDKNNDGLLDTVISRLDSNFQVVTKYDLSSVKLTMTLLDSVPTSGNVNTEIKVPKIKVTESATSLDAINAYVKVTITNRTTKEVLPDSAFDYENYTFTPNKIGDYIVTYKASIGLFGLATSEVTPEQSIKVSDKQSATVRPTYDYEIDKTNATEWKITAVNGSQVTEDDDLDDLLLNTKASIPSHVKLNPASGDNGKQVTIKIPAIYGTDNWDTLGEITFERSYRAPNGAVTTITNTDNNRAAEITLSQVGDYEIRYRATDRAGNAAGYAEYIVHVHDVDEDLSDGETEVTLNINSKSVSDRAQYLTFTAPTATDKYDDNIEVKTFYKVNGEGTPVEVTEKNTDGKCVIDIKKLLEDNSSNVNYITVYAEAHLDSTLRGTRDASEFTTSETGDVIVKTDEITVNIINSRDDQDAPEITDNWNSELYSLNSSKTISGVTGIDEYGMAQGSDVSGKAAFNQGNAIIELPVVKFTDAKDANLKIGVEIRDSFGNLVSKVDTETITKEYVSSKYEYSISGLTFKLSNYGVYTITYRAQDVGGNVTVKTYGVRVNDTTAPTIVIEDQDKFDDDIEVGQLFEVPSAKLIKNGQNIRGTITWDIYNVSKGAKYDTIDDIGFVPLSEGTFSIVYYAEDEHGNRATLENSLFTVTAKDTIGPEITLEGFVPAALAWNPDEGETYQTITIPAAFANDGKFDGVDYGYGKDIEVVYTVTGPNSSAPDVNKVEGNMSVRTFKATTQGTYTIKYTATDDAGNTTTETRTLALGDCEKPTLEWKNEKTDLPTTAELNKEFTLDLSKIILGDNETAEDYLRENLTVTLTDPSGSTVTNKGKDGVNAIWDIKSTGNYTLKFVVKDKVGNANTYSYQINVPSEEADEEKISPVVGTILVVAAVAVLAGVVVYFVVSSKKKTPSAGKKASKKAKTSKK